jgi:hypothetical protein
MTPSSTIRSPMFGALLGVVLSWSRLPPASAQAAPASPSPSGYSAEVQSGVARLRKATASFVTLDSAVAAGYARDVPKCYADEHHGAMGFHHINRAYVDARIEIEKPEILLYERLQDGSYKLNGAEYIIPYRIWPRDSVPPTVFGLTMKQEDNLKLWYLHTWAYKENAAGLFADWNPAVKCLAG